MADGRSAEEAAATDLCDDSRVPRERHKNRVVEHHSTSSVIYRNNDHKHLYDTTQRSNNSVSASEYRNINNNNNHHHHNNHNNNNNNNIINNNTSELVRCVGAASEECDGDCDDEDEDEDDEDNDEEHLNVVRGNKLNTLKNVVPTTDVMSINIKANILLPVSPPSSSSSSSSSSLILLSSSSTSSECGGDKLIDDIGCTRNIMLERCMKMENCSMLMEYGDESNKSGIVDGNILDKESMIMKATTNTLNSMNTVVVDAAAAAVAVSAIPETMNEIHQHKQGGDVVARLGSPFKGQIRMAEDTLVGPCGKKRCADRYDSSESSDSGVTVSCGECSSSGTSDITEPGSPCSTSSDEGVAIRGTAPSPLPSLPKLAPPTLPALNGTRPQWPWTPPLATTACSTYKRINDEPEAGTLPKSGAADPTARGGKTSGKNQLQHYHNQHETQGKITEYFKTQIKPQLSKSKKTLADMSVLVAKSSPEFRRPPSVQRNKGGLAKYLGAVTPNGRIMNDWEVRTMTISSPLTKKLPNATPRVTVTKLDKILVAKALPGLPITTDILTNIPGCKITSLRLTSETSSKANGVSQLSTPAILATESVTTITFDNTTKPIVNENNNITSTCPNANHVTTTRSQLTNNQEHPLSRLSSSLFDTRERKDEVTTATRTGDDEDEEEEEEEEDSSRSSGSKPSSSPILSAPTTIRFPARTPAKNGTRATDSGICRWDKCDADFECSGALLEHLQAAHINTQTGGDNFVCHWQGCKVQGRTSCSRRWLERHVLSHGGNKPFRCIVDGCGSRFSSQTALERHVNSHFNQPETSNGSSKRSCENGGKLVRRNGKKLRYRRQPWSARLFDYFDTGVMEGLQHRLLELAKTRTQGQLAETPGTSMALTSQVLAKRVETDGKTKVLLRWYPQDITPDEWVLESEVQKTKHMDIRGIATTSVDEVKLVLYPAVKGGTAPLTRVKQRRKPAKIS